jgi:hypothetical protein
MCVFQPHPPGKCAFFSHFLPKNVCFSATSAQKIFTANKVPSNGCYHPIPMWNTNLVFVYMEQRN